MYNMTMKSGTVVSLSAVNKAQVANASILFGKNAQVLVKRIDELVKIKELDTAKLEAILDILKDADATTALAKKAAGKNLVTAVKALYKAKTLVAVINGLRAIKIKPTDPNATTKTAAKAQPVAKTKGDTGAKAAKVVAVPVNQNAELPKVNLSRITPAFMKTVSQAQIDAVAAQLTEATGMTFVGVYQETNGQSSPWTFEATNPKAGYKSVSIDPPYAFHSQMTSVKWAVSAVNSKGQIFIGRELKAPSAATLANAVKDVIGKPAAKGGKASPKSGQMSYDEIYKMVVIDDNDDPETGARYLAKLFRKLGLKPKSKDIGIGLAGYGGDEDVIVITDYNTGLNYAFGKSAGFIDYMKPFKGKGAYTIVSWSNPDEDLITKVARSSIKQKGVYKTVTEFDKDLMDVFKSFAK